MKKYWVVFLAAILISCSSNSPEDPGSLDLNAITNLINDEYANLLGDPSHYGSEDTVSGNNKRGDIQPLFWYRDIPTEFEKDLDISIDNDTADVSFIYNQSGELKIFFAESLGVDSVVKVYSDNVIRIARFIRVGGANDPNRGWKLRGISMPVINSQNTEIMIDSVVIALPDTTYHLTRHYFESLNQISDSFYELVRIRLNDTFTTTVFTRGNQASLFLHITWPGMKHRVALGEIQTGIHSRNIALRDTSMTEIVHFTFDAFDRRTLFTDDWQYYSKGFSLPVKIINQ
ncbi:hypothetical protein JXA84_07360 [candidate division WOR-3 bacterium]|nr:hypothetical protein [candidate division WOR-3 bacterium]